MNKLDNVPTKQRDIELFIDPFSTGWEVRYYKILFGIEINIFLALYNLILFIEF